MILITLNLSRGAAVALADPWCSGLLEARFLECLLREIATIQHHCLLVQERYVQSCSLDFRYPEQIVPTIVVPLVDVLDGFKKQHRLFEREPL